MATTTISHVISISQGTGRSGWNATLAWSMVSGVGILVFAATQAWVAYRKLSLDLFDRRFETYQALNAALNDRVAEIGEIGTSNEGGFDSAALHAVWLSGGKLRLLFPRRVSKQLDIVEADLKSSAILKAGLSGFSRYTAEEKRDFIVATRHYMDAHATLASSRERLAHLVTPLMVQFGFGPTFFTGWMQRKGAPGE